MSTLFEQAKATYKAKQPDIQSAWLDTFDENVKRKLEVDVFKAETPAISITIPVTTTAHISTEVCKRLIERWNARNGGFNIAIAPGTGSLLYVTLSGWAGKVNTDREEMVQQDDRRMSPFYAFSFI